MAQSVGQGNLQEGRAAGSSITGRCQGARLVRMGSISITAVLTQMDIFVLLPPYGTVVKGVGA